MVILLNFVIALISQYYEDVMNSKVMHKYIMRNRLNHEYHIYYLYMVRNKFFKDEKIDAVIIIDGEEAENEEEWRGLIQTMKRVIMK